VVQDLIVGFAGLSILVLLWALGLLALRWKRALYGEAKWLLVALLCVSVLHEISNLLEWTARERLAMPFEDYFLLLLPAIWGCFFYVFLQAQSRAELRESEEKHRSLTDDVLDTTGAGICILDSSGHVVWINQAYEEYFQLERNRIVGRAYSQLIHSRLKHVVAKPDEWAARMLGVWDRDAVTELECHILPGKARPERWLECRCRTIHSGLYAGGRIKHFYDITERKLAAEQREELLQVLETQKAELERFVYTASHDLKSPLITIQGFAGILGENLTQGAIKDAREDIARIERAASRMSVLLDELLELAKIGRESVPMEPVELAEVISDVLEFLQGDIKKRRVTVAVRDEAPSVVGHRARLVEVFQNLIDNSIKYMGNQPSPKIEVSAEARDEDVICFVRDNGIGIKPKYREKVFDLFEQLNPESEGSGTGLAIVKRIVETHGGQIWLDANSDAEGTTFWFTLPMNSSAACRQ